MMTKASMNANDPKLLTVVVWNNGDKRVRPVGPTSYERQLLGSVRDRAAEKYDHAAIVGWSRREDSVKATVARLDSYRAEQAAINAAIDEESCTIDG